MTTEQVIKYDKYGNIMPDKYVEQYIGLKDKNGVEIYDGDCIKLEKDYVVANTKIMEQGYVKWCEKGYWCVVNEFHLNDYNRYNKPIKNFPIYNFEVIGNIHEGVKE